MTGEKITTPSGSFDYTQYLGSYTVPTTMLGTPALAYPIGTDESKMPVSVQIHGPRFSDRCLVQRMQLFKSMAEQTEL